MPRTYKRATRKPCSFRGCDRLGRPGSGLCPAHHDQQYHGRPLRPLRSSPNPCKRIGGHYEIDLGRGRTGFVSLKDAALLRYRWGVTNGYVSRQQGGQVLYMHRAVLRIPRRLECDHRNGNRLDNRRRNLRVVTTALNSENVKVHKNSQTGRRGVRYDKRREKFAAYCWKDRVFHWGGYHATLEEAHRAAIELRAQWFTHQNEARSIRGHEVVGE